ncbi:hypothetical protein BV22DRAFT_1123618 [Leucogyrophana mollusca]|uniref:Uncharacterized protein n=1 Tax=Leucogyrophana mollusca TaxID=85980 RepID=A0ACB8B059_9AGAM|nr:hypothetical protein BV22DRAFT_1123618 [Leucogyrophana mollusca]
MQTRPSVLRAHRVHSPRRSPRGGTWGPMKSPRPPFVFSIHTASLEVFSSNFLVEPCVLQPYIFQPTWLSIFSPSRLSSIPADVDNLTHPCCLTTSIRVLSSPACSGTSLLGPLVKGISARQILIGPRANIVMFSLPR